MMRSATHVLDVDIAVIAYRNGIVIMTYEIASMRPYHRASSDEIRKSCLLGLERAGMGMGIGLRGIGLGFGA